MENTTKVEKGKEQLIKNINKEDARKAYFGKKLPEFLNKIQALGGSEEVFKKLEGWLDEFKKSDEEVIERFNKFSADVNDEERLPTARELFSPLNEDDKIKMENWIRLVDDIMKDCIDLAKEQRDCLSSGYSIDSSKLLDLGLRFLVNEFIFNNLLSYRERVYKAKIIEIIDDYNVSRREAQDRAEITKEYFDYNVMKMNLATLNEIIVYAKKYNTTF
jgi:hypothetical protein